MKKITSVLFFCLVCLALNAQGFERVEPLDLSPLNIECSITLEDGEDDYYSIYWSVPLIDSIAKAEGELPRTELHCFVRDSSGVFGYYTGLSAPMQFCYFQTKDSTVEVFFRWRRIPYAYYTQDSTEIIVSALRLSPFDKTSHRGSEFESVLLSVHSTTNRKLTLLNDTNTVRISYGTHSRIDRYDPLGHPYALPIGSIYSGVITLDRYYVSMKTGRIATGKQWVDRKGPKKMVQNYDQFILVSPSKHYINKNNKHYLGSALIQSGRVNLRRFNLQDFRAVDIENFPY